MRWCLRIKSQIDKFQIPRKAKSQIKKFQIPRKAKSQIKKFQIPKVEELGIYPERFSILEFGICPLEFDF
jgi:hypothetical protein